MKMDFTSKEQHVFYKPHFQKWRKRSSYWTCPQNDGCVFQEAVTKKQLDQSCFICLPARKDNTVISAGSLGAKQKVEQQEYLHQMIW